MCAYHSQTHKEHACARDCHPCVEKKHELSSFLPVYLNQKHICTLMIIQTICKQCINKLANGGKEMAQQLRASTALAGVRFSSQHSQTPETPLPRDTTPICGLHL